MAAIVQLLQRLYYSFRLFFQKLRERAREGRDERWEGSRGAGCEGVVEWQGGGRHGHVVYVACIGHAPCRR
jgi:hypothetical protein